MSIEEQIAALEARIQQAIILASGCTERAELAATRAEEAAARAELAGVQSQQAELVATLAATTATTSAAIVVEEEEAIEETLQEAVEEIEDASQSVPNEGRSDSEREATESDDLLDGEREAEEGSQPTAQPIVIAIKESAPREQRLFKRNNTRFSRGRTY